MFILVNKTFSLSGEQNLDFLTFERCMFQARNPDLPFQQIKFLFSINFFLLHLLNLYKTNVFDVSLNQIIMICLKKKLQLLWLFESNLALKSGIF